VLEEDSSERRERLREGERERKCVCVFERERERERCHACISRSTQLRRLVRSVSRQPKTDSKTSGHEIFGFGGSFRQRRRQDNDDDNDDDEDDDGVGVFLRIHQKVAF
jgi:hypothetical protein